jgi:hypothetical protein
MLHVHIYLMKLRLILNFNFSKTDNSFPNSQNPNPWERVATCYFNYISFFLLPFPNLYISGWQTSFFFVIHKFQGVCVKIHFLVTLHCLFCYFTNSRGGGPPSRSAPRSYTCTSSNEMQKQYRDNAHLKILQCQS